MDIAEVIKRAKAPERVVELCLDADLRAQHQEAERRLQQSHREAVGKAGEARRKELAEQIRELEGRMQGAVVQFRMRGLTPFERQEWLDSHPAREGKTELFNPVTGAPALIAACCVEPQMTEAQARELGKVIGNGDWDRLFDAAWQATMEDSSVPFSFVASAILQPPATK